jgi:hypothetical protein
MKKCRYLIQFPLLLLFALLISFLILFYHQLSTFSFTSHSFTLKVVPFLIQGLLFFLLLSGVWMGCSRAAANLHNIDFAKTLNQDFLTYLPLLFLILLPFLLSLYIDVDDLLVRTKIFVWSIFFSILYLKSVSHYQFSKKKESFIHDIRERLSSLSIKKKLFFLFIISLLLYNTGSVLLTSSGQTFAGDEPHYLIITQSLSADGDFDVSNNYANRDYTKTMLAQVRIDPHTAPGTGGRYSFHSPGTSLVLLPFYSLGSLFGGKFLVFFIRFGMSLFGALLGTQIFLYIFQKWKNEKYALVIWFVYSFTTPVFFYSLHIYPEIIVAFFSFAAFRLLHFSSSLSKASLALVGFLISCSIWFHAIKYVFILVPLFIYAVWVLIRKYRVRWNIFYFLAPPFVLFLLHFLFQYLVYDSVSFLSVSIKGSTTAQESLAYIKSILSDIPLRLKLETLAGYFFDQRDGLLLYAPVYFFALLGCVEMIRKNLKSFLLILFLTAPYILNSALLTQRTSYAPQARPLVSVSWALAIFLSYFLVCHAKKIFLIFFNLFAGLSLVFVLLLLKNPLALYQLTTSGVTERAGRMFLLLSNLHFFLPQYLPSYLKIDNSGWIPNFAWMGGLLLLICVYIAVKKHSFQMNMSHHLMIAGTCVLIIFFWLVLYPRTVLLYPTDTEYPSGEKIRFYSLGRVAQMIKPGIFQLPRDSRPYIFHLTSWRKINNFRIDFGSQEGTFEVSLRFFDQILYQGETTHAIKSLHFSPPSSYPFKNSNLYRLSIYIKKKTGVIAFSKPFLFKIIPRD